MIVTRDFIENNRTEKGGFTKRQLEILGVRWPPPAGWNRKAVGMELSPEQAEEFCTTARVPRHQKNATLDELVAADRTTKDRVKEAAVLSLVEVDKSKNVKTRVQLAEFAGRIGVSIRDFTYYQNDWWPTKQGVWIPIGQVEQVIAAMQKTKRTADEIRDSSAERPEETLQEMEEEGRVLRELSLGCI